jgi:hypothetical protein
MTALTNNGILPATLKDIYFRSDMADSGEKFILDLFFRLTLVLMLFLMVGPATAGTLTETDKSVRSIVSGIVSYTRWPSLSGQPKLCIYATSHYTHALSGDEGQRVTLYSRYCT